MQRTRIKICGLTRPEDVAAVAAAGADAAGFVFYPKSPRYVTPEQAGELIAGLPPFIAATGLFVNASPDEVAATVKASRVTLLQFHGDETAEQCAQAAEAANTRYLRVFRVKPDTRQDELLEYERICRTSSPLFAGLLLDTWVDAYGGAGKVFDWSLVPKDLAHRAVLSGGLSVHNATGAVAQLRPYAVDISSGVEASKGIKDPERIAAFVRAVRAADALISGA